MRIVAINVKKDTIFNCFDFSDHTTRFMNIGTNITQLCFSRIKGWQQIITVELAKEFRQKGFEFKM